MAFQFGGISEKSTPKNIVKINDMIDFIIEDKIDRSGTEHYMFLLDKFPSDAVKIQILKEISRWYSSYIVLVAVDRKYDKEKLKGQGLTEFMVNCRSNWRQYLNVNSSKCVAILSFGSALYSINGCADILPSDFYEDEMLPSYYYMGEEVYKYNTFIYPVDGLDELYPVLGDNSFGNINFKTRFFYAQCERMSKPHLREWVPDLKPCNHHIIKTKEEADRILKENENAFLLSLDTETNGLIFYENKIHCITACWNGIDGYYFPWHLVDVKLLSQNMRSCKHITGANPKFDIKFFWEHGVDKDIYFTDATDMLAHILHSEIKSGLKPLSFKFTPFGGYDLKLDLFKKQTKCEDYSQIAEEILAPYAIQDAINAWRIQWELWNLVDIIDKKFPNDKMPEWTIRRWYETQAMPIYQVACEAEYKGLYVDNTLMETYRTEMLNEIEQKKKEMCEAWDVPEDFKFKSTVEIGKLFEKMGWECYGRSKDGSYITDDTAMKAWARDNKPGIKSLIAYRNVYTALNSFIGQDEDGKQTGWMQFLRNDLKDGNLEEGGTYRIHHGFGVMKNTTLRFRSMNPNFQNIPTRGKYAPYVKKCVTTPPADLYILTSDSGKEYHLAEFEFILTQDGYKQAKDCLESDIIIENTRKPVVLRCSFDRQEDGSYKKPDKEVWFQ